MGTSNILDELEWRGLIAQSTDRDALAEQLAAGPVTVYSGFDPTGRFLYVATYFELNVMAVNQRTGGLRPLSVVPPPGTDVRDILTVAVP